MAYGLGASLASMGENNLKESIRSAGAAANMEANRNQTNQQIEAQNDAAKVQLGSSLGGMAGFALGAQAGSIGGPMGALIGGAVGAIAGGLFD